MRKVLCTLFLASLVSPASAELLRYEPFNYNDVGAPVLGKTNPDGATWVSAHASPAPTAINVASGNLAMPPGIAPPIGNSAEIDGVGTSSTQAGKSDRLPLGQSITSGTVYYSFALRIDELTGSPDNGVGGFGIALNNSGVATAASPTAVAAKVQIRVGDIDPTKYNLGIFNNRSTGIAASTSWSPTEFTVGTTHFIVASYDVTNDVSRLWIDPVLNGTQPVADETDLVPSGIAMGDIESIILRQSTAPHITIDEIRVGTTWQSVIPEPASLGLLLVGTAFMFWNRRRW